MGQQVKELFDWARRRKILASVFVALTLTVGRDDASLERYLDHVDHAVETMNFAANDVHVAAGVRVLLRQLVLEKLQMQHNGVDRIFDFVSYAAGYAPAG